MRIATQIERRTSTRSALLDAAVASLVDHGVAGFTTPEVVGRAGLSNGALFRHFPTKADLLATTVEHVFHRLRTDYEDAFNSLATEGRTIENLLSMLWDVMSHPALAAVYEVYTSARTDTWMQTAIEPVVTDHMNRLHQLALDLVSQVPGVAPALIEQAVNLAILAMQGLVVNLMARPDEHSAAELVDSLGLLAVALLSDPQTTQVA